MAAPLQTHLQRWIRRYRAQRMLAWAAYGLAGGLALGGLIAAYVTVTKNLLAEEYLQYAVAAATASLFTGLLAGWAWPVAEMDAARRFDQQFNLKERISTALELQNRSGENPLRDPQLEDAQTAAGKVDYRSLLRFRIPRISLWISLALLAANAAFWFYGEQIFNEALEKRRILSVIQEQAAQIEALVDEIEANPDLTEEQKDELTGPLKEALTELDEARTLEEAFSALEEAEEQLKGLEDPAADRAAEDLQQAGEALAGEEAGALEPFAESLSEAELGQAADDLRSVDAESMEQAELDRLADQLESLADAVESSDPELAAELRDAAEAARSGDGQEAQEALARAAEALEDLEQQAAASQAAEGAAEAVGAGQEAIVAAGQQGGAGEPAAGAGDSSNGEEGSGSGSGSGEGSGENGESAGSEAGTDPISQGNHPDGTGESDFQPISPSGIAAEGSDWIAIPPSGVSGDNVTGSGSSDPGNTSPITVPYTDVFADYLNAVNQAIDAGLVPPQYRDLIHDYFSSLEPD